VEREKNAAGRLICLFAVFIPAPTQLFDVIEHPNQSKYPDQQMLVVKIKDYAYLIPFVKDEEGKCLKKIIPNRKATREYLGG